MNSVMFVDLRNDDLSWTSINILWFATNIYATTARMLFYFLCRILSDYYINIRKEIEHIAMNETNIFLVSDRLSKLADQHKSICRCVDKINKCFGLFLLIDIINIFFNEINFSVYIVTDLGSVEPIDWVSTISEVIWLIYSFGYFSIICFASDRIQKEVMCITQLTHNTTYGI